MPPKKTAGSKKSPLRLKIKHSFPAPSGDDRERFAALVRMLLKLGEEKK
jgi:hypothetical protein